jgi:hypothetical protein
MTQSFDCTGPTVRDAGPEKAVAGDKRNRPRRQW